MRHKCPSRPGPGGALDVEDAHHAPTGICVPHLHLGMPMSPVLISHYPAALAG